VNQGRRLKGAAGLLAPHLAGGDPPELGVHERKQLVEGRLVAGAHIREHSCDRSGRGPGFACCVCHVTEAPG